MFENHVPVTTQDRTEKRGCILCWEDKGVVVEAMGVEEWGVHMRAHFKDEGYWVCGGEGECMQPRGGCRVEKCRGVHC